MRATIWRLTITSSTVSFSNFAEQHEGPLVPEIGLYGFYHLVVVAANRLELVIKNW